MKTKKNYFVSCKILLILLLLVILVFFICFYYVNLKKAEKNQNIVAMNNVRQKFLLARETTNNTYYVSQNGTSTEGTDINNPMSFAVAKTKSYHANDKILFKCGDIFYDRIIFKTDLSEGENIYIGSYGDGEKPIISGAKILEKIDSWEKESDKIYKLDLSNEKNFAGMKADNYNIGFFRDEIGNIYAKRKSSKEGLNQEGDFYCKDNYLYLYSEVNPSDKYGKIKLVSKMDMVRLTNGMIIENLNIQDTGAHGIVKHNTNEDLKNIYIGNCIIQNIGGSVLTEDTFTRYGNGIEFYDGNVENIIIENNIIRNIYDVAFTCQGNEGTWKNIEVSNNIFILNSQNCEFWTPMQEGGIENFSYHDNISINIGKGWGYEVRPDKWVSAEFLMYAYNAKKLDVSLKNNKIFNARRLNYISSEQRFIDDVQSDYNYIYYDDEMFLIDSELTVEQKDEFISQYNKEKNSQFIILDEEEIEKISNNQIMYSNDYNVIKEYYNDLEKEFKYNELAKEIIANYTTFQQKYQTDLSKMQDITSTIETLKNEVKTLSTTNLWTHLDNLYKTGETIITKYQNKTTNLTKQKMEEILTEINKIGESYISLIDNMQITQNPQITDLQTLLQSADKLDISITENSDLDIVDEKVWRDSIKNSLEIVKATGTTEEYKSYNYIKAKNMLTWTSNMIEIYIDEYIQANPINITYSTTLPTNKDVTATLNIGNDCQIANNNNQKTYIFKENGEFIFEYKRRGKTFQAKATVSNIDKRAPEITGVIDEQVYNQPVRIEVKDSNIEKLEIYLNGSLQSNSELIQAISKEGFYKVNAIDKAGNRTSVSFDIIYKGENDYDVTKDKICNITVNTTVEEIAQKLPFGENYTIYRDGRVIQENEKVATGDILKLQSGREYTLIVKGDLNSDGVVNIVDLVRTQNAILKRRQLTEIEQLAADANYDKEQITIKDLVRIQIIILNPTKM